MRTAVIFLALCSVVCAAEMPKLSQWTGSLNNFDLRHSDMLASTALVEVTCEKCRGVAARIRKPNNRCG